MTARQKRSAKLEGASPIERARAVDVVDGRAFRKAAAEAAAVSRLDFTRFLAIQAIQTGHTIDGRARRVKRTTAPNCWTAYKRKAPKTARQRP